jgi:hypothetical protein
MLRSLVFKSAQTFEGQSQLIVISFSAGATGQAGIDQTSPISHQVITGRLLLQINGTVSTSNKITHIA